MKSWLILSLLLLNLLTAVAQSDYLEAGNKQYQLLDRLDIYLKTDSVLGFTTAKPYHRHKITERILYIDSLDKAGSLPFRLSRTDRYNLQRLLMDNEEWAPAYYDSFRLKKPVFKSFYKNPAAMFAVHTPDFKLMVNPLLNLQYGHSNDGTGNIYLNTRGIALRGNIDNKLGFYSYITENQERDPLYVRRYVNQFNAVPGIGYYKLYGKNGYDYFDARGGITFNAGKHFDFVFAYDKLFIGNGYRSLLLSDFANSYLFFKINTRVWKFNYENVFAQLTSSFPRQRDTLRPQKYLSLHHLSFQAFKWLNFGVFESIMFGRSNGYELHYLNPLIFYKSIEQQMGSPDKVSIGLDFKINAPNNMQFYGQLLINEFVAKDIFNYGEGNWRNKQALQLGAKYINAFGVHNLDLQGEVNWIRPYTYSHRDSIGAFSHYNQSLAHPLGANLRELVLLARYQPFPRLYLQGRLIAYLQGLDSAGKNFGSNILLDYDTRAISEGVHIGSGLPVHSVTAGLNVSYELFENMFLDGNATYRTYNIDGRPKSSTFFYTMGFRVNLQRREFNF